jgi:hypothetical protein
MGKKLLFALAGILVILAAVMYFLTRGPDLSQFEYLKEPQIRVMENLNVLVVEAKGDPNIAGKKAFGLLFKTYFSIKGAPKGPKMPAPRARWPLSPDTPQDQWMGLYAIPVPPGATLPPDIKSEPGIAVRLDTWEYGEVAEILHIGPYDREEPTVSRLTAFIKDKGYTVIGDHEEEYLKGPGMFFAGNPENYFTIIRYRVQKTH